MKVKQVERKKNIIHGNRSGLKQLQGTFILLILATPVDKVSKSTTASCRRDVDLASAILLLKRVGGRCKGISYVKMY